jgi:hypothetical protein
MGYQDQHVYSQHKKKSNHTLISSRHSYKHETQIITPDIKHHRVSKDSYDRTILTRKSLEDRYLSRRRDK